MPQGPPGTDPASTQHNPPATQVESPALNGSTSPGGDVPFGGALEPVLLEQCQGRLTPVTWFRTDWQRGGAATGYSAWTDEQGVSHPAVVKLPVTPGERQWLARLQDFDHIAPRLYAHGEQLGGYDIAWVVMERLVEGPLGAAWGGIEFDLLIESVGRFYAAASSFKPDRPALAKDWNAILKQARDNIRDKSLEHAQRWTNALKKAQKKLPKWIDTWSQRDTSGWCHGDLHLGNAMTRTPAPEGPALLFDYAETRPGHWLEDAVPFEQLYWSRRDRLDGRKLCSLIAKERKKHDLPVEPDWPQLASVKRALVALSTPAKLHIAGNAAHVQAALEVLEAEVGT